MVTAIIGISLFVVGVMICYSGVTKTYRAICGETLQQPGVVALIAAIVSIVMKEWAYQFTVKAGRKYHSEAVVANAWHHRSDALSSIGTMFGIGGAIILGEKWAVLDPLAAIIVSAFIIKASVVSHKLRELLLCCVHILVVYYFFCSLDAQKVRFATEKVVFFRGI